MAIYLEFALGSRSLYAQISQGRGPSSSL